MSGRLLSDPAGPDLISHPAGVDQSWVEDTCAAILSLGVPAATHGTPEPNAGRHGWLTVGVAFKINQAPPQGIKEPRLPVSGILAGKVRVDQADGGGTFAHRCRHPFD